MCENAPVNLSIGNTISVGFVINDEKSSLTSLGHTDIFNDTGFHANGIKMSKNGSILAVGSRQRTLLPNQPTNRPGLHIYMKKTTAIGTKCCDSDADAWKHYQSIIFDNANNLINIDSLAISADGSSVVAVGGTNANKIYVFEEINICSAQARWVLQQTLTNDSSTIHWTGVQLDDQHRRLVVRSVESSTTYDVYERLRLQKKCSSASQDPEAYLFQFLHKVTPIVTDLNPLSVDTKLYVLSHDGQTLIIVVRVVTENQVFNHINQYEFDCTDKQFKQVATVLANTTNSGFFGAQIVDIHFAGPCSEKLLVLIQFEDDAPYLVEVYTRLKPATKCCATKIKGLKCCVKDFNLFDENSLQAEFADASPDPAYTVRIVSNPFDSESFLVFESVCVNNQNKLNIKLWRQCLTDASVWCKNEILKDNQSVGCLDLDEWGTLSLDNTCGKFCYAANRQFSSITLGTFSNVYVNDPDGFFYLNASHGVTTEEIYFRVVGDANYTLFDKSLAFQALKFCSTNSCNAKLLELVLVDGPPPVEFIFHPTLIKEQVFIPIKTCFTTFCYK